MPRAKGWAWWKKHPATTLGTITIIRLERMARETERSCPKECQCGHDLILEKGCLAKFDAANPPSTPSTSARRKGKGALRGLVMALGLTTSLVYADSVWDHAYAEPAFDFVAILNWPADRLERAYCEQHHRYLDALRAVEHSPGDVETLLAEAKLGFDRAEYYRRVLASERPRPTCTLRSLREAVPAWMRRFNILSAF